MVWKLTSQQIKRLKDERGLVFKRERTGDQIRPPDGDVVGLEQHTWLTLFEALVEFKRKHGHTYVTQHNASEELHFWVKEQRKKMMVLQNKKEGKKSAKGTVPLSGYQVDLLRAIGFVYYKNDIDWMENYERLAGEYIRCNKMMVCLDFLHSDCYFFNGVQPSSDCLVW